MKNLLIYFIFLWSFSLFSQGQTEASHLRYADSLTQNNIKLLVKKLYTAKSDGEKAAVNTQLLNAVQSVLQVPGTFDYDFDSVQKDLSFLRAPDNMFRIIHWDVEKSDGTYEYFGFIQSKFIEVKKHFLHKTRTETMQLYPLIDRSFEIKNPENAVTDNKKWYGMRYYRIIPSKTKSRNYYTLLGWDGNDKLSQKKIIDVLSFDNTGVPHFGADLFNFQKKYPKRVIFEYSSTCNMLLKYNTKKDSIVFGHLAPIESKFEGQYQYYCSDLSFDGFGFRKGKWNYGQDLNMMNERDDKDKFYGNPHDRSTTNNESNNYNNEIKKRSKQKKRKKE